MRMPTFRMQSKSPNADHLKKLTFV